MSIRCTESCRRLENLFSFKYGQLQVNIPDVPQRLTLTDGFTDNPDACYKSSERGPGRDRPALADGPGHSTNSILSAKANIKRKSR